MEDKLVKVINLVKEIKTSILYKKENDNIEIEVEEKGKANYVTKYDKKIEEFLKIRLREIIPESNFLGEESGSDEKKFEYTWVVDPIDGTTNFIYDLPFAISIGLVKNKKTIMAVVYDGTTQEIYSSILGKGSYLNGKKLSSSQKKSVKNSILAFGFPYDISKTALISDMILSAKIKGAADIKRIGPASLDVCRVASGKFDGYFELDLEPWDLAAAILILTEAGGSIIKMDGKEYEYEKSSIIATNRSSEFKLELFEIISNVIKSKF